MDDYEIARVVGLYQSLLRTEVPSLRSSSQERLTSGLEAVLRRKSSFDSNIPREAPIPEITGPELSFGGVKRGYTSREILEMSPEDFVSWHKNSQGYDNGIGRFVTGAEDYLKRQAPKPINVTMADIIALPYRIHWIIKMVGSTISRITADFWRTNYGLEQGVKYKI